ncbi:hypothetical protein B0J14DRAFT_338387 [Halenospora varia]|nr:hypothetical protein B0J14DRAFT_338387 [Halenospora varia]
MSAKRILVIGGTGAQGFAVVKALLASNSTFTVRVLSRNPDAEYVQKLFEGTGVELVKGSFMDFDSVEAALQNCYGVFVNTDGFTVKESDEIWAAIRIWEIANTIPTLRHFLWSSIDYYLKLTGFNHKYAAHHTNAKGRVNDYLGAQTSSTLETRLAWTIINTGAYAEQLQGGFFAPEIKADGTRVFSFPLGDGHLPLMTLQDMGVFTEKIFSDREAWSGKTLNVVSEFVTGQQIADTLTKVAGVKAIYQNVSMEEWLKALPYADVPVASTDPEGITIGENFAMWWPGFQDSLLLKLGTRDIPALKKVHPGLTSLEQWMVTEKYDGTAKPVLKGFIDGNIGPGTTKT